METTTYENFTPEDLGPDATAQDLAEFQALCMAVQDRLEGWTDEQITAAVFGGGDYIRNAAMWIGQTAVRRILRGFS